LHFATWHQHRGGMVKGRSWQDLEEEKKLSSKYITTDGAAKAPKNEGGSSARHQAKDSSHVLRENREKKHHKGTHESPPSPWVVSYLTKKTGEGEQD